MTKSASIYARVEPELKEQVEQILTQLGLPMANAINLFLNQIVLQKGLPFNVKLPDNRMLDYSALTQQQFDMEIEKGMMSVNEGKTIPASAVRERMQKKLSL